MIVAENPAASLAATTPKPASPVPTVTNSIVLHGVSWQLYQALRNEESNNHVRMTFDRGDLELMSPLKKHGKFATLLDRMIYEWTRLHRIKIESGRDMTCDRDDLEKGLEPDLCYWIANQHKVFGKDAIDFAVDPPPDLALEVEMTRTSIPKLPIYEALKVPEVWRWKNGLEVLHLSREGHYATVSDSVELPGFPCMLAADCLSRCSATDETTLLEQFEAAISSSRGS